MKYCESEIPKHSMKYMNEISTYIYSIHTAYSRCLAAHLMLKAALISLSLAAYASIKAFPCGVFFLVAVKSRKCHNNFNFTSNKLQPNPNKSWPHKCLWQNSTTGPNSTKGQSPPWSQLLAAAHKHIRSCDLSEVHFHP